MSDKGESEDDCNDPRSVNWRIACCGGPRIHGTDQCLFGEDGSIVCVCQKRTKNFNFPNHFYLAQFIQSKKLHLTVCGVTWNQASFTLFTTGCFKKFKQVLGPALKSRFYSMVEDVKSRHGLGEKATGFETHPPVTPYDEILIKMMKEMYEQKEKAEFDKSAAAGFCIFILILKI